MTILTRSAGMKVGNVMVQSLATLAGTALTAFMVLAGSAEAQAPSLTPTSDFGKVCAPAPKPFLTRDWSQWDKSQPVIDPEEMYDA
ncbi:MAG TPA: hypothetical protein VE420_04230, partial [Gemmatimonadales bacterium]|nr:hypothetical protein [Gemmatimonadales bacterium]